MKQFRLHETIRFNFGGSIKQWMVNKVLPDNKYSVTDGTQEMILNASEIWSPADENKPEAVDRPAHYNSHPSGIECITIAQHMNFNLGNVMKYIWRTDHKNGLEDLKKARRYLDYEIKRLEGLQS